MNLQEKAEQNNDHGLEPTSRRQQQSDNRRQNLNEDREGSSALVSTLGHLTLRNAMESFEDNNYIPSDNDIGGEEQPNPRIKSKRQKMIVKNILLKRMRLIKVKLRLKRVSINLRRGITKLVDLKRKTAHFYDVMIQSKRTTLGQLKKDLEEYRRQLPPQLQQTHNHHINRRRGRMHLDNVDLYQEMRDQENNVPHGSTNIRPHPG